MIMKNWNFRKAKLPTGKKKILNYSAALILEDSGYERYVVVHPSGFQHLETGNDTSALGITGTEYKS